MGDQKESKELLLNHKLKIIRIIINKSLIVLIIIILCLFTNLIIENIQKNNVQTDHIFQKKYNSAIQIREGLSIIINGFYEMNSWTYRTKEANSALKENIKINLDGLTEIMNNNAFLFSREYDESIFRVIQILSGFLITPGTSTKMNHSFFRNISDYITHETRKQIGIDKNKRFNRFIPIIKSKDEIEKLGAVDYFKANFELFSKQ